MSELEQKVLEIYKRLVMAEHEAGKIECFTAGNKETYDWARGYQEGVGKALDLLGPVLGLGVKLEEEASGCGGH